MSRDKVYMSENWKHCTIKKKNNSKRIKHACSETLTVYKCHKEVVGCLMAKALINYLPEDGDPDMELSQDRK